MDYKVSGFDFHNWIGNQKRGKNAYLQIGDGIASNRRCSIRRGLRVRSEMDGDSDGNRSERSDRSLTATPLEIARSDHSFQATNGDTLSIVWLIDFQTQRKFQTEKNEWDRTWRLSGSSEIGEKCVRKTKGKKKKTKALQQDKPKKNGLRLRLIHAA